MPETDYSLFLNRIDDSLKIKDDSLKIKDDFQQR